MPGEEVRATCQFKSGIVVTPTLNVNKQTQPEGAATKSAWGAPTSKVVEEPQSERSSRSRTGRLQQLPHKLGPPELRCRLTLLDGMAVEGEVKTEGGAQQAPRRPAEAAASQRAKRAKPTMEFDEYFDQVDCGAGGDCGYLAVATALHANKKGRSP